MKFEKTFPPGSTVVVLNRADGSTTVRVRSEIKRRPPSGRPSLKVQDEDADEMVYAALTDMEKGGIRMSYQELRAEVPALFSGLLTRRHVDDAVSRLKLSGKIWVKRSTGGRGKKSFMYVA